MLLRTLVFRRPLVLLAAFAVLGFAGCNSSSTPSATPTSSGGGTSSDEGSSKKSSSSYDGGSSSKSSPSLEVSSLKGKIEIDGSSTVQPISNAIQEQFKVTFPGVEVGVSGKGTGNGFNRFSKKETDISGASRPIKAKELKACQDAGVAFIELPVAYDGLTFVIHPENDWAETLTVDQLKMVFGAEDSAMKWSDVDGSWPDEKINIFSPGTGSGTYDYTREVLAGKGKLREDMNLNEDDNVLVAGVAGNKYSVGFFGVAYYEENKDKLKAVKVVNPKNGEAFLPTTENISSNKYAPFSRPLFIYVNSESLAKAEVQAFVDFYLTNAAETCEKVGYVRLPDDISVATRANYDSEVMGTHFVDATGEARGGPLAEIFVAKNLVQ